MANKVNAQVLGGATKTLDNVETVQDVMDKMGLSGSYTIKMNGETVEAGDSLEDYAFLSFGEKVKGGNA